MVTRGANVAVLANRRAGAPLKPKPQPNPRAKVEGELGFEAETEAKAEFEVEAAAQSQRAKKPAAYDRRCRHATEPTIATSENCKRGKRVRTRGIPCILYIKII